MCLINNGKSSKILTNLYEFSKAITEIPVFMAHTKTGFIIIIQEEHIINPNEKFGKW